ncbi:MAG: antitoxin Xre/MbcA/ParS toxin-binding domain-containing protein [Vulcanimicrobiaceae bacterium]
MAVAEKKQTGRIALAAFRRLAERWHLRIEDQEVLLAVPKRTLYNWYARPEGAAPDRDKIERISYMLGILGGLTTIYGDNSRADEWLRRENDAFGKQTPLQRMLAGNVGDLAAVRAYVDRFAHVGW